MRGLSLVLGLVCLAGACSGGGGHASDGSVDSVIDLGIAWPDGCPPPDANDKGIGLACTRNGGECKNGLLCTCDPALGAVLAGVPCVCTKAQPAQNGSKDPCKDSVPAGYCGTNATCCDILNAYAYCVPNVCLVGGACLEFVPIDGGT
ncbi:MAG TPA: hypothetical protein VHJ20_14770 [Polyangia bacterium]|nr:hypothetical protein [Polyangia bacterium]